MVIPGSAFEPAQTLQAVQELARAVLQKDGPGGARLRVDIGGYRERRREALSQFTRQIAEQVVASGTPTSLEPMGAANRKVVHDTVNELDGVRTDVRAGSAVLIALGTEHLITNTGSDTLRFLCCCAPCYEHDDTVLLDSRTVAEDGWVAT